MKTQRWRLISGVRVQNPHWDLHPNEVDAVCFEEERPLARRYVFDVSITLSEHDIVVLVSHVAGGKDGDRYLSRVLKSHCASVSFLRSAVDTKFTLVVEELTCS